jgi:RNA 2',3'-cyclic 3'-phosphodiesterase
MRCFLAVPLAEPALADAQRVLTMLRREIEPVRWARPETLHITVQFYADAGDDQVRAALRAANTVVAQTEPFPVTLDTLGAFPPRGSPRVLWLGSTQESPPLVPFATRCRAALRDAGLEVDDRPFRVHCTLGRPRMRWSSALRHHWLDVVRGYSVESTFIAHQLVLYESTSAEGGAIYTPRATLMFPQPADIAGRVTSGSAR